MVAYELVPSVKLTCRAANSASGLSSLGAGKPRILSSSDCESEMSGSSYRRCFQDSSPGIWMIFRYDPSSEYSLEQIARESQQRQKCATSHRGYSLLVPSHLQRVQAVTMHDSLVSLEERTFGVRNIIPRQGNDYVFESMAGQIFLLQHLDLGRGRGLPVSSRVATIVSRLGYK